MSKRNQWGRTYQVLEYPSYIVKNYPKEEHAERVSRFWNVANIMLRFWKRQEQTILDSFLQVN